VDGIDFALTRDNPHDFLNRATITVPEDFNRDGFVDGLDMAIVRDHSTDFLGALKLITAPASGSSQPAATQSASSSAVSATLAPTTSTTTASASSTSKLSASALLSDIQTRLPYQLKPTQQYRTSVYRLHSALHRMA
jgi:hypothetical protein